MNSSCKTSLFFSILTLIDFLREFCGLMLKACIYKSYYGMVVTGPNDHIGSAGLTNRNIRSCEKIFGGQRLDETSQNKQVLQLLFAENYSLV